MGVQFPEKKSYVTLEWPPLKMLPSTWEHIVIFKKNSIHSMQCTEMDGD